MARRSSTGVLFACLPAVLLTLLLPASAPVTGAERESVATRSAAFEGTDTRPDHPQRLATAPTPGPGQNDDLRANRLEAHVSFLAADFTRGRETGTEGFDIAASYAAALFTVWGLQPGGDLPDPIARLRTRRGRSYFQSVPLVRSVGDAETTMTAIVSRDGAQQQVVLQRRVDFDVAAAEPFDIAADLVFVGYGRTDAEFDELAAQDLEGKMVLRLDGLPGQTAPEGALYKRTQAAMRARFSRIEQGRAGDRTTAADADPERRFFKALRDRGAVGCLTVTLSGPDGSASESASPRADTGWAVNAPFRNLPLPMFKYHEGDRPPVRRRLLRLPGRLVMATDGRPELFADRDDPLRVTITPEVAEVLVAHTGQTLAARRRRIDASGQPASGPIAGTRVRLQNEVRAEVVVGRNVIGVVPGSDPALAGEVVVVAAHLDHIGAFNDAIYNGADDNASGAAAVLELARAFVASPIRPRRTLVFALWCGEEDGFLGARYFIAHPYAPLDRIVAIVNPDMIGRLAAAGDARGGRLIVHSPAQVPLLKQIAARHCRTAGLDAEFREPGFARLDTATAREAGSDHAAFGDRDIGFLYWETGLHEDYHSPLDHADRINFAGLEQVARAMFLTVQELAQLAVRPAIDRTIVPPRDRGGLKVIRIEGMEPAAAAPPPPAPNTPSRQAPATGTAALLPVGPPAGETGRLQPATTREIRLTFDLLGKTDDSRFAGTVTVSSGGRTLLRTDTIMLRGFRGDRQYVASVDLAGLDPKAAEIRWEVDGTLYDSALPQPVVVRGTGHRAPTEPFRGIGFHIATVTGRLEVRPLIF